MCGFCDGKEVIERVYKFTEKQETLVSLRIDEESQMYMLRNQVGSVGYTLPIQANYCMFCGSKLIESY